MTRKRRGLNAAGCRDKPKMIANSLNHALSSGDTIAFVKAIGDVTRARGMTKVSQETGLDRRTLYKSFGGDVMPHLDRVIRTLAALKLKIVVKPISPS
jgi:probable addiction module antidote protein